MWKNSVEMLHVRSLFLLILLTVKLSSSADVEGATTATVTKDGGKVTFREEAELSTLAPTYNTGTAVEKSMTSSSTKLSAPNDMSLTTMSPESAGNQTDSMKKTGKSPTTDVTAKTAIPTSVVSSLKPSEKHFLKKEIKETFHTTTIVHSKEITLLTSSSVSSGVTTATSTPVTTKVEESSKPMVKEFLKELEQSSTAATTYGRTQPTSLPTLTDMGKIAELTGKKDKASETTSPIKHSTYSLLKSTTAKPNRPKLHLKSISMVNKTKTITNISTTTQTISIFKMVPSGADIVPPQVKDNTNNTENLLQINLFSKARIINGVCIAVICVLGFIVLVILLTMYAKARNNGRKISKRMSDSHELEGLMNSKEVPV